MEQNTKNREGNGWPIWVAIALLLVTAYGSAYVALVKAVKFQTVDACVARYPAGPAAILSKLFRPANWIDRKLFPKRWPGRFVE